jgi:tRNA dimethylallyltransferase
LKEKTIFIIVGPTAVGKTAASIRLAQWLQTKIISADSRQCFRELDIGVAKPSKEELATVPHYFINSHSIHEEVNAALYEKLALQWAEAIFQEKDAAVMVGGTGLYIKAFCEGLDEMPQIDPVLRNALQEHYQEKGMEWLKEEVKSHDPQYFAIGEIQNPQRMLRALEVKKSTGKSILDYRSTLKKERPFRIKKIGLQLPKEKLHQQIHHRVNMMIEQGLVEEVKNLMPFQNLNALQTVGYSEIFDYLNGEIELSEAIDQIKKNTRHYAKRQMTWFKKDKDIEWLEAADWAQLEKITQW